METGAGLSQAIIENPILNSPFAEPNRHFRFDDEGHGKDDPLELIVEVTGQKDGKRVKIIVLGAKKIRRAWVDGEWHFSVVDIVGALTSSANRRNYWNMIKAREKEASEV